VPNHIRFLSFIFRKVQLGEDLPGKGEVACKEEMSLQLKICLEASQQLILQQTESHSWLPGCKVNVPFGQVLVVVKATCIKWLTTVFGSKEYLYKARPYAY
jgi:hypothetical protein